MRANGDTMERAYSLDGLRAIAVLIVMISHAGLGSIIPGGFGVTIFFFLSGYLITSLLVVEHQRAGRIDFLGFFVRRAVRILPPMWIAILLVVAISQVFPFGNPIVIGNIGYDLLFLTNYAQFDGHGSNIPIPLWSLDIEEHYYLAFPFVFAALFKRYGAKGISWFSLAGCVLVLAMRFTISGAPDSAEEIYYSTHTRIDSILFGCLLATFNSPEGVGRQVIGASFVAFTIGLALILASFAVRNPVFQETVRYSVQGIGLFFVFNYVLRTKGWVAKLLSHKWFRPTANFSYFLYLIHLPLYLLAIGHSGLIAPLAYALGFAGAFAAAWVVHYGVERPLAIWRKSVTQSQVLAGQPRPKGLE